MPQKTTRDLRTYVQIIRGDTLMRSCIRGTFRRRLLSTKSRAYYCWLQFWPPVSYVVLDYCPLDQHMHYRHAFTVTLLLTTVLASYFLCGSRLLPARPHALQAFNVCLLFNIYPINLDRISVACSSGLPLLDRSKLLPALRCSRLFKKNCSPGGHCCTRSVNPQRYFGRPIKRWVRNDVQIIRGVT